MVVDIVATSDCLPVFPPLRMSSDPCVAGTSVLPVTIAVIVVTIASFPATINNFPATIAGMLLMAARYPAVMVGGVPRSISTAGLPSGSAIFRCGRAYYGLRCG